MVHRAAARRGVTRSVAPRRQTLWLGSQTTLFTTTTLGANQGRLDQSLTAEELGRRPFTIVRTRGTMFVQSDQVGALEEQFVSFGMAVVSDQAIDVGVSAVPDPYSDLESDLWFLHVNGVKGMTGTSDLEGRLYNFDSKAMRKVEDGQDIAVVIRNVSSAFGFDFFLQFRILIKTH